MKKVLLISLVVLVIAISLLYIEFKNNPVKQMEVRDGMITGREKGFLEARSAPLAGICVSWLVVLLVAFLKVNATAKQDREVQQKENQENNTKNSGTSSH